jgi:hypothetical protein
MSINTISNLLPLIGITVTPAAYSGRLIETLILSEEESLFGGTDLSLSFYDDEGEECCLEGIPWGAFWDAEVLSDLSPLETARWVWEELNFYGEEEDAMEYIAGVKEKANLT